MRKHETEDRTRGVPLEDKKLVHDIYNEGVKFINESALSDIDKRYYAFELKNAYNCCFEFDKCRGGINYYKINILGLRNLRKKVKEIK